MTGEIIKVPSKKIRCYITGEIRQDIPEEHVRQRVARSLVEEYGYSKKDIDLEFSIKMGRGRKKADIVIFEKGKKHSQENIFIIVEAKREDIKPKDRTEGIEQLKTYMSATINCKYGMWVGSEIGVYEKTIDEFGKFHFVDAVDIPREGVEDVNLTFDLLVPATDVLKDVFWRCHNYISTNQGFSKDQAFHEFLKIIFCKVYDERESVTISFYITNEERRSEIGQRRLKKRIDVIFNEVKSYYSYIFDDTEKIKLDKKVLAYIVGELQKYSLISTEADYKGQAYEEIVGSNLRGDKGEFFTPRNLCELAVNIVFSLIPKKDILKMKVLDPACGTGGFLKTVIGFYRKEIQEQEEKKWNNLTKIQESTNARIKDICDRRIFGIDFNPLLVRAAQMNLVMHGDGSANIYHADSLKSPGEWKNDVRKNISFNNFDIVFTNPPFGENLFVDDPHILDSFELSSFESKSQRTSLPPEQLFIERCHDFVKPSGYLAIVTPDNILSNPGLKFVRRWIIKRYTIIASIYLPSETFEPSTGTQTSLLVLQKKEHISKDEESLKFIQDYDIFMKCPKKVGHDKRGNLIVKRDENGNEIYKKINRVLLKRNFNGAIERDSIEIELPLINDDLPITFENFLKWYKENKKESKNYMSVSSHYLLQGEHRLDASFYVASAFLARKILKESGFSLIKLDKQYGLTKNIFNPPPIKRIYTDNLEIGTPYMLPSEMFDFVWLPEKYVIAHKMPNIGDWFVKKGWIVLTQSGNAGKPFYVTDSLKDVVLSQNAIRIIPDDNMKFPGYIYAFLSTWMGQALLKKDEFGITVKHIRPHHVADISIPDIPDNKKKIIHMKIDSAFKLRDKANKLIHEAEKIIYEELKVPERYIEPIEDESDE